MGDVKINDLSDIWYGERFMNLRKNILDGRKDIPLCEKCDSIIKQIVEY